MLSDIHQVDHNVQVSANRVNRFHGTLLLCGGFRAVKPYQCCTLDRLKVSDSSIPTAHSGAVQILRAILPDKQGKSISPLITLQARSDSNLR